MMPTAFELLAPILMLVSSQSPSAATSSPEPRMQPYTFRSYDGVETVAELGRLTVPANRNRRDGRSIEIAFVRLPSSAAAPREPILFLAGGPGIPGVGLGQVPVYAELFRRLQQVSDVILLDQRGVGLSDPVLRCESRRLPPAAWSGPAAFVRAFADDIARCSAQFRARGHDPADFSPEESAHDIERLRRALGIERLNLLAWSYGTEVALAAMRAYPRSIGRSVLAGVRPPGRLLKSPRSWEGQFRSLARIAAADPAASSITPDLYASFSRALGELRRVRPRLLVRDSQSGADVEYPASDFLLQVLVRLDLSDLRNAARLPALLRGVEQGDYELLRRRIEQLHNGFAASPTLAVDCASGWTSAWRRRVDSEAASSLFSAVNVQWSPAICAATGVRALGDEYRMPVRSDIPVMLISGSLDPNSPPALAEQLRRGLPRSLHVIFENAGHELLPVAEARDMMVRFFEGGEMADARIPIAPPRFVTREEALRPPAPPRR